LRAAAILAKTSPQVDFCIVGDGPLRPQIESYAQELGIAGRVQVLGHRDDIPQVLASLDLLVMPSLSESLSNVIVEAMAAGVPVVATHVGGTAEVIRDGESGILVPANDVAAIADAMERLIANPDQARKHAGAAQAYARQHFRMDEVRNQYELLYTEILCGKLRRQWPSLNGETRPL